MDSVDDDLPREAGFPHSDIPGSQPVCRLPETFRRLPRPSSPLAAKASTRCACSLGHITRNPPERRDPATSRAEPGPGTTPRNDQALAHQSHACACNRTRQNDSDHPTPRRTPNGPRRSQQLHFTTLLKSSLRTPEGPKPGPSTSRSSRTLESEVLAPGFCLRVPRRRPHLPHRPASITDRQGHFPRHRPAGPSRFDGPRHGRDGVSAETGGANR